MDKYNTRIKVTLSTMSVQDGENANEVRKMTKMIIYNIFRKIADENEEFGLMFKDTKLHCSVYIERFDKPIQIPKHRKRIIPIDFLKERIVAIDEDRSI